MANSSYRIGIDGGGTKTELILIDAAGTIVARHVAAGCNPSHLGHEAARTTLRAAIDALLGGAPDAFARDNIAATRLFMAGAPQFWTDFAREATGLGVVTAGTDALPVLELATGGAPGLVLHAGTGSFVAARAPDGSVHYAGGLGWRFGDPGSGYELGRRAVAAALMELSGWATPTGLGAALREHAGLSEAAAIKAALYAAPDANARIAAFAPRVIALAEEGCRPAQAVIAGSIGELVAQARLVTDRLFPGARDIVCGVSGAVLNNPAAVFALRAFTESTVWPVELRFISEPPIEGVRRLLLRN